MDPITYHTWNELAQLYQDKFMDLDLYNDSYDLFCAALPRPDAKVLEIGCGPGNIARYLLAKLPQLQLLGIDAAPNMIALAKANNPTAQFAVMECSAIDGLADLFDGIIAGFCLPYLSPTETATFLHQCHRLLSVGGCLYISVIEGNPAESGWVASSTGHKAFVHYYEATNLVKLLELSGFSLTHTLRKAYPSSDQTHLILLAQKS